jgi:hypothetical protein
MWNPLRETERQLHTLYPDLPPEALLNQLLGKDISTDRDELQRAHWFWRRRPNKLILRPDKTLRIVTLCLLLWMTSMFVRQQAQVTVLIEGIAWATLAAIAVAVFVDIHRYAQWKWEYCRAISRLVATANR